MKFHRQFESYIPTISAPPGALIYAIKQERYDFEQLQTRFLDVTLRGSDGMVTALPFVRVENGELIFPRAAAALGDALQALAAPLLEWAAKKAESNLEMDVLSVDEILQSAILAANSAASRALPALAPYRLLFREFNRYANLTPYVRGAMVHDLNPGFGYGAMTLRDVAAYASVAAERLLPGATRFFFAPTEQRAASIVLHLGVEGDLRTAYEYARAVAGEQGRVVLSQTNREAVEALRDLGAVVVAMRAPGVESLDRLEEWMALFGFEGEAPEAAAPERTPAYVTPKPLRVLFALRPSATHAFGGDVVQIRETAKALRERGHFVEVTIEARPSLDGFDILHLSNVTVPEETLETARHAASFPGAIVLMPIFTDHADEAVWGMRIQTRLFVCAPDEVDLSAKLEHVAARRIGTDKTPPPPVRSDILPGMTRDQRELASRVDYCIANAHAEMHRFYRYIASDVPYAVAPSAADPQLYGRHARTTFVRKYGIEDFVLVAGRYEHRKNQLLFAEATRDLGLPIVSIGSNRDASFAFAFQMYRPRGWVYFPHLPESELAGAFAAARVVAIPSWDEVVSLTSLNAAISEAAMVLTRNSYEHEYFRDDAQYCDPADIGSIRQAVMRAWTSYSTLATRRSELAERVRREYSWQRSAELTEQAYYRLLAFNPRGEARRRSG